MEFSIVFGGHAKLGDGGRGYISVDDDAEDSCC